jgi:hypothetical protein
MKKHSHQVCPECGDKVYAEPIDRRNFLKAGAAVAAAAAVPAWAKAAPDHTAEELIKELYTGLSDEAKKDVVAPYEHADRGKIYNKARGKTIGQAYTKAQQELVGKILRALSSGEQGWEQFTRQGTWDASKSFEACGADLFGDPNGKYTWVFSGHHLTIRSDGSSSDGVAFGGPLYYGHTPNGYNAKNCFNYQTKTATAAFESLTEAQRKQATVQGTPGEGLDSIKIRAEGQPKPGIALSELDAKQRELVDKVMSDLLSPYRKADAEEALAVIRAAGGMDKVSMAFYAENEPSPGQPWSFWRLEGPSFVWNFRVLPHVHTFVRIQKA